MSRDDLFVYERDMDTARAHFSQEQSGRCAICQERTRRLVVDHEHSPEALVRGLLCDPCNQALGCFRDNVDAIRRAADYLERHQDRNAAYRETDDWQCRQLKVTVVRLPLDDVARARRDREMRAYAREGHSANAVAATFGVSPATVYKVVNGNG